MLQCLMIVGGVSFCVPTLQFHPADCASLAPNPFSSHALSSVFFPRPARRALFCTRVRAIPFLFHSLRTLCMFTRGCHLARFSNYPSPTSASVSLLESALTAKLRVGFQGLYLQTLSQQTTEISRNRPPTSPLESTLTRLPFVTPLESALTKKGGRGML